jgi:RNA polymerase sigma factor (sigma-70 family)
MSNDENFAAAYREHYWAVSRYVARRLDGRSSEVEEVVAEVFTVAWRRRADLPPAPLPWLYGVARNCLANAVRGYGRRRRLVDRLGNDESAHGRQVAVGPEAEAPGAWVHEALARLSPADQEVLRLTAWEELGVEEVAVVLGCGVRAAAMRLHRARRRLRAEIDRLAVLGGAGRCVEVPRCVLVAAGRRGWSRSSPRPFGATAPQSPRRTIAMADELELLRSANPFTSDGPLYGDGPLDHHAERGLNRLLHDRRSRRRRLQWSLVATAAVAATVLTLVLGGPSSTPAVAAPRALVVQAHSTPVSLKQLAALAAATAVDGTPALRKGTHVQSWSLGMSDDKPPVTIPEERIVRWNADDSHTERVVEDGHVLKDTTYPPSWSDVPPDARPPHDVAGLRAYLQETAYSKTR